jgi:hypothetical protein
VPASTSPPTSSNPARPPGTPRASSPLRHPPCATTGRRLSISSVSLRALPCPTRAKVPRPVFHPPHPRHRGTTCLSLGIRIAIPSLLTACRHIQARSTPLSSVLLPVREPLLSSTGRGEGHARLPRLFLPGGNVRSSDAKSSTIYPLVLSYKTGVRVLLQTSLARPCPSLLFLLSVLKVYPSRPLDLQSRLSFPFTSRPPLSHPLPPSSPSPLLPFFPLG